MELGVWDSGSRVEGWTATLEGFRCISLLGFEVSDEDVNASVAVLSSMVAYDRDV